MPFAGGPSPAVQPFLLSLVCVGLLALATVLRAASGNPLSLLAATALAGGVCFGTDAVGLGIAAMAVVGIIFCATAGTALPHRPEWMTTTAAAWLFAGLVSVLIGLCQYFGVAQLFEPWMSAGRPGEAFGNLRQRNQFASLTGLSLLALLWLLHARPWPKASVWLMRLVALMLVTGNAASASRTGLLQLLLITLMSVVWRWKTGRKIDWLVWWLLPAYAAMSWCLPYLASWAGVSADALSLFGRLKDGTPECFSRRVLWSNVAFLIGQKPWFGWGWGELDYAHYMTLYEGARFCDILDNAHNLPLQIAVELGIPVALLICGGFAWVVLRAAPWRDPDPARQLAWGVLALILLHSLLEYPLWYGPFQMALGLSAGLLWCTPANRGGQLAARTSLSLLVQSFSAIVLLALTVYASWDYHRVSQIYLTSSQRDAAYREDTLSKIRGSWLFQNQARFAELSLTPLGRDNAEWTFNTATALLHYSPEPHVIEKVIESAVMLGRDDEAMAHMMRYRAAFPADYARWTQSNKEHSPGLPQRMP